MIRPLHPRRHPLQRGLSLAVALTVAVALLGFGALGNVHAQEAAPAESAHSLAAHTQAVLHAQESELSVGDPSSLVLEVDHPAGTVVILPTLERTWGDFDIRSQSAGLTATNADGSVTTRWEIEVALFAPGTFTTPPLPLTISDSRGNVSQTMAAPASLTVRSVLVDGDSELRDIKPQAELPSPPPWPTIAGASLAAALLLAVVVWWIFRRRGGRGFLDRRPADQRAYDSLDRIAGLRLPEAGQFKKHYALVSHCLRLYIDQQIHIPAQDLTTGELRRRLRKSEISPSTVQRLLSLLGDADLVKFSKVSPDVQSASDHIREARAVVKLATAEMEEARVASEQAATIKNKQAAVVPSGA